MKRRRWEEVKNKNAIRDPLLKRTLEKKSPPPSRLQAAWMSSRTGEGGAERESDSCSVSERCHRFISGGGGGGIS